MRHELNFWVLGGDMRQGKLAQLLAEDPIYQEIYDSQMKGGQVHGSTSSQR